jgi:hypothetical protein
MLHPTAWHTAEGRLSTLKSGVIVHEAVLAQFVTLHKLQSLLGLQTLKSFTVKETMAWSTTSTTRRRFVVK